MLFAIVALAAIAGVAAAVCRRVGHAPFEVLVWFGLAEAPKVHPWHRDRSRRLAPLRANP